VQWAGSDPWDNWTTLLYRYDAAGRRVEKLYNYATITKYVYDGDHCIAEYDGSSNLQRKYIYGPSVDEPIAMIESAGSYAGTYYYHFDGLGSVVGLTNASGNTVQVYEYDVYGRVGATDARHPNRIMFTGREYDKETGLYYYRARYYNPQIGRFLQTDPIGYGAGMNWHSYCGNNPVNWIDAYGYDPIAAAQPTMPATGAVYDANNKKWWWLSGEWSQAQISAAWNADPSGMYMSVVDGYSVWVVSTKNQTASGDTVEITGEAGIMDDKASISLQARIWQAVQEDLNREQRYAQGDFRVIPWKPYPDVPTQYPYVPDGFPWDKQPQTITGAIPGQVRDGVTGQMFDWLTKALLPSVARAIEEAGKKTVPGLGVPWPASSDLGRDDPVDIYLNNLRATLLRDFAWAHWWADWLPNNGWNRPSANGQLVPPVP
jgi:RHS repeat-associated protein